MDNAPTRFGTAMALSGDGRTLAVSAGAFNNLDPQPAVPPFVYIFTQNSDGVWSQQTRMPAGIIEWGDVKGDAISAIALSRDGSTLAVHSRNSRGNPTAELDINAKDLTCGGSVIRDSGIDGWYLALYGRDGSTWRRQALLARGLDKWALASDGNAIFYGNELFSRRNGVWTCP